MTNRLGSWLRTLLGRPDPEQTAPGEADVERDTGVARTRQTGGRPDRGTGDAAMTTGPGENDTFVGRVSGDDLGAVGETGAEARRES